MDSTVPASVFDDLANLKAAKPDLKIFVSIGGWTFSDNGTTTQPVFGNIAKSAANRQTFADNALRFLNKYGFDGVDIDWEYPGAPDRGGSKEDTENYVSMLKTLRETFDNSGANLDIKFTAPSSYWYLQWFDVPGLLKYADWVNLMTYDLHGVWDSTNPIGSIVQAHTNLTEIKLAVELLWRVNVRPSQVVMGFGFYGRAFTLADSSCTTIGCPFSSSAKPGPCTATSGYLAYYEIEEVLKSNSGVDVIWDKDAAAKYFTWDTNQWISYEDSDTFKQKVDWANDVGIGGALIWASDLDNYEWTAHKALTGRTNLGSELSIKVSALSTSVPADLDSFFAQDCFVFPFKVDLDNPQASSCGSGYTRVGYDKAGCKGKDGICGKPICCKTSSAPKVCKWRGFGGDWNGQCHAGEVELASSSWGGIPGESGTGKCRRGKKAFCCEVGIFNALNLGCYWTSGCDKSCKADEQKIAHITEVTLRTSDRGDSFGSCNWNRKKALCCTPNLETLTTMTCDADLCADDSCETDEHDYDDYPTSVFERAYDNGGMSSLRVRSYEAADGNTWFNYDESIDFNLLEKRGPKARPGQSRSGSFILNDILKTGFYGAQLAWESRPYPSGLKVLKGDGSSTLSLPGGYGSKLTGAQVQMIPRFLLSTLLGQLPTGAPMKTKVNIQALVQGWNKEFDVSLPRIGSIVTDVKSWTKPLTPNDRVFEVIGSYAYRTGMSVLQGSVNQVKGNLMGLENPVDLKRLSANLAKIASGAPEAEKLAERIMTALQSTPAVFNYINDAGLQPAWQASTDLLHKQLVYTSEYIPGLENLYDAWLEFEPDYYNAVMGSPWGYVVIRAVYGPGTDEPWQRMLEKVKEDVRETFEYCPNAGILPERHVFTTIEDAARLDGASSHEVRDVFMEWVVAEKKIWAKPPDVDDAHCGTRYNFCLFFDAACLKKMEHSTSLQVKLLSKNAMYLEPDERNYEIYPGWEDGETEHDEEDVGWMYLVFEGYVDSYASLDDPSWWHDMQKELCAVDDS
ncbi:chitinase [Grosmannia clavigera kw1407]|uniref:chitinase n=1 Tax=Grosmannia clavigera (strain kw1407 / UAMH 11150) TaxID=655863 RepID=F0X6K8_GROCL|nr:chitinase [Grosmannia clavigera kw1407]EFX06695.1 chitinase [Grosmannia clavigera kw1407]